MRWIGTGAISADMINLVVVRYLFETVMGPVDKAVEHLASVAACGTPALAEVSILVRLVADAYDTAGVQLREDERSGLMRQWVSAQLAPSLVSTSVGHFQDGKMSPALRPASWMIAAALSANSGLTATAISS